MFELHVKAQQLLIFDFRDIESAVRVQTHAYQAGHAGVSTVSLAISTLLHITQNSSAPAPLATLATWAAILPLWFQRCGTTPVVGELRVGTWISSYMQG